MPLFVHVFNKIMWCLFRITFTNDNVINCVIESVFGRRRHHTADSTLVALVFVAILLSLFLDFWHKFNPKFDDNRHHVGHRSIIEMANIKKTHEHTYTYTHTLILWRNKVKAIKIIIKKITYSITREKRFQLPHKFVIILPFSVERKSKTIGKTQNDTISRTCHISTFSPLVRSLARFVARCGYTHIQADLNCFQCVFAHLFSPIFSLSH